MSSKEKQLSSTLNEILSFFNDSNALPLGHILEKLGTQSFGILLAIIALPSALPIPAPGFATPFGLLIALLGIQMILMRSSPYLPKRIHQWPLKKTFLQSTIKHSSTILNKLEYLIRPRLSIFTTRSFEKPLGILITLLGTIMAIPLPLTNTPPAIATLLIALALCERDGLLLLITTIVASLLIATYAILLYLFIIGLNTL